MTIYEFMSESPWLTFFLSVVILEFLIAVCFRLPNRILRHRNIKLHGWPPEYCDADGDFKADEDKH